MSLEPINVESVKTVALRGWDCRMFVSDVLWNDANYALSEGTQPAMWREVATGDVETRDALRGRLGTLPEWPGEFVEYPGAGAERAAHLAARGY